MGLGDWCGADGDNNFTGEWVVKEFIARQINNFHYGHFLISKGQFIIGLTILAKLFEVSFIWYPVIGLGSVVFIWFLGWLYKKSGLRKLVIKDVYKHLDGKNESK